MFLEFAFLEGVNAGFEFFRNLSFIFFDFLPGIYFSFFDGIVEARLDAFVVFAMVEVFEILL